MAEAILNKVGSERFRAFSAGSHPAGTVNRGALRKLRAEGYDVSALYSKSWNEFTGGDAPVIDIVITVCGNAAGESCPVWNGAPVSVHWGIPDPAAVDGDPSAVDQAFDTTYESLYQLMSELADIDADVLCAEDLASALKGIGRRNAVAGDG